MIKKKTVSFLNNAFLPVSIGLLEMSATEMGLLLRLGRLCVKRFVRFSSQGRTESIVLCILRTFWLVKGGRECASGPNSRREEAQLTLSHSQTQTTRTNHGASGRIKN